MKSSWAVVDYPPNLGCPNAGAGGETGEGVSTSEAWAAVTVPSACRAVEAVRTALVGTNRHLVRWTRIDRTTGLGSTKLTPPGLLLSL